MKTKIIQLLGTYNIKGNYLFHFVSNRKLLISERQNVTDKKAISFLLDKTTTGGCYISSLYASSTSNDIEVYNFDYNGLKLKLELNKGINRGHISKL